MSHFGFKLPNCGGVLCPPDWATPETLERLALEAANAGFDSLWLHDHVLTPGELQHLPQPAFYDPFTVAVRLASLVPDVQLGIATLVLPFRDPVILAKQLATAGRFFPGRLIAGLGSGRYESEFKANGSDRYAERGRIADEYFRIMTALFSEASVTIEGAYRTLRDAQMYPKPRPGDLSLWLAANGPLGIKRAARLADGWIAASLQFDEFEAAHEIHRAARAGTGRGPAAVALSVTIDPDDANAASSARLHRHAHALRGSASQVAAELGRYAAAGVTHFLVSFPVATQAEVSDKIRWFESEVRPNVATAAL